MGFLKDLVGIAAPIAGSIFGGPIGGTIGGALGGAISGSGQPKSTTSTQQQQLDPRISDMLFGANGQSGLLSQYQGMLDTPRSAAGTGFAGASGDYLSQYGASDMGAARNAALGVMGGNSAPMAQAPQAGGVQAQGTQAQAVGAGLNAYAKGNMVQAPSQNGIDLAPTFQNLLGGGDTSKLMGSLQAGNALAGAQFNQNQQSLTDNLQRNIMPGIRSNAVLAGQYGGSRQGVAEGLAMSDLTKQLNNSNTQFGLGATAASSSALANSYENGQNRSLAAAQGLSGQQYATAFKDADTKNAAEFMNVGNVYDLGKFNAGLQQQTNLTNANSAQQNNQFNAGLGQQTNQFNAGLGQQTNLANMQSQLTTNAQNNSGALGGAGLLSGLLGSALGTVNQGDNWGLDRAQGVNSLLAPYLGANSSSSRTDPLYSNPVGSALGGLGLGAQLGGLFGGSTGQMGEKMGGLADLFGGKFMNFG